MTRRIPRQLAEECFRLVSGESTRHRASVEFDVLAWKHGIVIPMFHPDTEVVPDPTGPGLVLEILHPTTHTGGPFGGMFGVVPHQVYYPVFVPGTFEPSEFDPGRNITFWSPNSFPRYDVLLDDPERRRSRSTGSWRVWNTKPLIKAAEVLRIHGTALGGDGIREHIREAVAWLS